MPAIGSGTGQSVNAPKRKVVGRVKPTPAKQVTQARAQEQQYVSQGRAVRAVARTQRQTAPARAQERAYVSQGAAVENQANRPKAAVKARVKPKGGGGPLMAVVNAGPAALAAAQKLGANAQILTDPIHHIGDAVDLAKRAGTDAAELAVTTPSSVAKLATTAVHDPAKVPGMLAQPYIDFAKHPLKTLHDRPVSTALMVAPAVRMPGRVVGKAARIAGKQTLERPPATLPGTALKEARTGSRDAAWRAKQALADRKKPAPTMTVKQVQKQVDEHFDVGKHNARRAEAIAVRDAKQSTKGLPKAQRKQARPLVIQHARDTAREQSKAAADVRFAQEFGATGRLSTGAAQRDAARATRVTAVGHVQTAKAAHAAAKAQHDQAFTAARIAVAKAAKSPTLKALETRRRTAQTVVVAAQKAHADTMAGFGEARGRAQILSRNVAGPAGERRAAARTVPVAGPVQFAGGGRGVTTAAEKLQAATGRVATARAAVKTLDQQIAAETQRIKGVPPAEHTALVRAIDTRAQTRATLAAARAQAEGARATHIAVKQAMRTATVTDHAPTGRLYDHQADARLVARKLNEQQTPLATGGKSPVRFVVHEPGAAKRPVSMERTTNTQPLEFTVRQVGDKYAVLPKVARDRMYPSGEAGAKLSHQSVGQSPSTMAKVMRRSRGAFTQAVLPLSLKWLGGQAGEAGVRSVVAGAGPMDWLRMGKIVKKMNANKAGSGDAYRTQVTAGHFDLTGAARDFADGKSLAAEFQGTALNQPAAAGTMAGHILPVRAVRAGFRGYSRGVIGFVNGAIEHNARRAMAGQAIKNSPLMEHHILGLTDKAITDAANGLKGTHAQVALARDVHKMYGRYSGFSPEMRSLLMHWTPFLPWFLNSAHFLAVHLPHNHPVLTALLADVDRAEEEWRKSHELSFHGPHVPLYMMGGYPKKSGGYYNLGHYLPTGAASQIASSTGGLVLPQMLGPLENLKGIDWRGKRLVDSHGKEFTQGQDALRAIVTAVEGQVPVVRQAGAVSGLTPRYIDRKAPGDVPSPGTVLGKMLPWSPTGGGAGSAVKVQPVSVKPVKVKTVKVKPIKVR